MPETSWLSLLTSDLEPALRPHRPARPAGRRDPWRNARTAFRTNPFRPPSPVRARAARGTRLRPSELRWMIQQRRF